MDKLAINDASLTYEKDSSAALGFGFRCGFLGLLHLDVIQERLQREFDIGLVVSAPTVKYQVTLKDGNVLEVDNPGHWPDPFKIASVTEPYIKATILTPEEYVGSVMELAATIARRASRSITCPWAGSRWSARCRWARCSSISTASSSRSPAAMARSITSPSTIARPTW